VLLAVSGGIWGCGGGGTAELPFGAASGDAVPPAVRKSVEKATETLYTRIRVGDFRPIYTAAATAARSTLSEGEFLGPIQAAVSQLGLPQDLTTEQMATVRFGEPYPYRDEIACPVEGESQSLVLSLTNFPEQAILVQSGEARNERFFFSSLWHREEGTWHLAGFFVKPATLQGKDWNAYAVEAQSQLAASHDRNAALLYNVAMDLVVPNAWMRPPPLEELRRRQSRISVEHLPLGNVDLWPAGADTFRVTKAAYAALPQLAVVFHYQTPAAFDDSLALRTYSDRLRDYVTSRFPEYADVFSALVLQGTRPDGGDRAWTKVYPLTKDD
jgi:hypothetical protein